MDDLISRQAAIDVIASMEAVGYSPYATIGRLDALLALNRLPSAERRGRWVNEKYRWIKSISMWWSAAYECSVCGEAGIKDWHYCPNCGARMEV